MQPTLAEVEKDHRMAAWLENAARLFYISSEETVLLRGMKTEEDP